MDTSNFAVYGELDFPTYYQRNVSWRMLQEDRASRNFAANRAVGSDIPVPDVEDLPSYTRDPFQPFHPGTSYRRNEPLRNVHDNYDTFFSEMVTKRQQIGMHHQNLESPIGQYFKQEWNLPYKPHSTTEPIAAATWASMEFKQFRDLYYSAYGELKKDSSSLAQVEKIAGIHQYFKDTSQGIDNNYFSNIGLSKAKRVAASDNLKEKHVRKYLEGRVNFDTQKEIDDYINNVIKSPEKLLHEKYRLYDYIREYPEQAVKHGYIENIDEFNKIVDERASQTAPIYTKEAEERTVEKLTKHYNSLYNTPSTPTTIMKDAVETTVEKETTAQVAKSEITHQASKISTSKATTIMEDATDSLTKLLKGKGGYIAAGAAVVGVGLLLTQRGTVHQRHQNLESKSGRRLKRDMDLPYKAHSTADPLKAARAIIEDTVDDRNQELKQEPGPLELLLHPWRHPVVAAGALTFGVYTARPAYEAFMQSRVQGSSIAESLLPAYRGATSNVIGAKTKAAVAMVGLSMFSGKNWEERLHGTVFAIADPIADYIAEKTVGHLVESSPATQKLIGKSYAKVAQGAEWLGERMPKLGQMSAFKNMSTEWAAKGAEIAAGNVSRETLEGLHILSREFGGGLLEIPLWFILGKTFRAVGRSIDSTVAHVKARRAEDDGRDERSKQDANPKLSQANIHIQHKDKELDMNKVDRLLTNQASKGYAYN